MTGIGNGNGNGNGTSPAAAHMTEGSSRNEEPIGHALMTGRHKRPQVVR